MTTQQVRLAMKATPEAVWRALIDGAITPAYYLGFEADFGSLDPGAGYRYTAGGGEMIAGEVIEVEEGRKLVTTFRGAWTPEVAALPESRVTFEIVEPFMPLPGVSFLSCTHEGVDDPAMADHLGLGWVAILSGMKTLLETGAPMVGPQPEEG